MEKLPNQYLFIFWQRASPLTEKIGAYVEFYGFAPQKDKADCRADGGITYFLKPNIMLDISGGFGVTEKAPEYYVAPGF